MTDSILKCSIVIPCLWTQQKFIDMTFKCVSTIGITGQIVVVGNDASYAENVNAGLLATTGDVIVVCNNDIEFIQPEWLEHLLAPLKDHDISSIRTTDSDGWTTEDKITEGDKFGSIWAMKRKVYETIGGLDESFGKGYFEDLDYQRRAENAGFKIAKNHAGLVEHMGKATFSEVDPDDHAYQQAMERYREKYGQVD